MAEENEQDTGQVPGQEYKYLTGKLLDHLPIGLVALDSNLLVLEANHVAQEMLQITAGASIQSSLHPDTRTAFLDLVDVPGQALQIQFQQQLGSLYAKVTILPLESGIRVMTIVDVSEQVALGAQLVGNRRPERKLIHDLNNALTSTLGYVELINMMLDENEMIGGERLSAIRRYAGEVFTGLKQADSVIKDQRAASSATYSSPAAIPLRPRRVMVVDDEAAIAEFLEELLKAQHYKVITFTSSLDALEYYREQTQTIDAVILDQMMPGMSGINLATELLAFNIDLPIILCTGDQRLIEEQATGKVKIKHFISKPIDINELLEILSSVTSNQPASKR